MGIRLLVQASGQWKLLKNGLFIDWLINETKEKRLFGVLSFRQASCPSSSLSNSQSTFIILVSVRHINLLNKNNLKFKKWEEQLQVRPEQIWLLPRLLPLSTTGSGARLCCSLVLIPSSGKWDGSFWRQDQRFREPGPGLRSSNTYATGGSCEEGSWQLTRLGSQSSAARGTELGRGPDVIDVRSSWMAGRLHKAPSQR